MNILDFIQESGIEYREYGSHHHVTSGWLNFDCPRCSPNSGHFRLGWNIRGRYFSCWSCGKLNAVEIWSELSGRIPSQIRALLKDVNKDYDYEPQRPPGKLVFPKGVGDMKPPHLNYLIGRGFERPSRLEGKWGLLGIDHTNPELAWRIFIPIFIDGRVVSWTTRATGDKNPRRYITAKHDQQSFNIKEILYGIDYCAHSIVIVEGPIDVWKIGPGAVALCGLQYSRAQLLAMSRFPRRYVCLDNEPGAQTVAKALCNDLMMFPGDTFNVKLDSHDPGCASEEELKKLRSYLE